MVPARISLCGDDWMVQGWVPYEWDLVGPVHLATGNLDLSKVMHGETPKIPATVPGCVQADLVRAGIIDDPFQGFNSRLCEWASQRMWTYQRTLRIDSPAGARVRLRLEGLDYSGRLFVNGKLIGTHEGLFLPAILDITPALLSGKDNLIQVVVDPAPESVAQVGITSKVRALKPRFAYKWDFTTRLIPLGLWDDVEAQTSGFAAIDEFFVHTQVKNAASKTASAAFRTILDSIKSAKLTADIEATLNGKPVASKSVSFQAQAGKNEFAWDVEIAQPQLWWPRGMGAQPIYVASIRIRDEQGNLLDERTTTFGIRHIEMVHNDNTPAGVRPYTLCVNGVKMFIKGYNWVPIEQMYGCATDEKYRWMIDLACRAGANMLRVWGGGLIEKELFYRLCDECGMLIWQEMPQSSSALENAPSEDAAFCQSLEHLARSVIQRRGGHPSLVFLGGGNELAAKGLKPLDETHPALAAIDRAVKAEHPNLVYVPTSPLGPNFDLQTADVGKGVHHDIHGPWKYLGPKYHYEYLNVNDCLLHGETGADGCSSVQTMLTTGPAEVLWPADPSNRFWCHHAGWWIQGEALAEMCGPIGDLYTLVKISQAVQAEALRYAMESDRRRQGPCSGTLIWQLSEPWPNLSCTSNVDYYGKPKLAYYLVRNAFAPLHVSMQHKGISVEPGSKFHGDIYVHCEKAPACDAGQADIRWSVLDLRGQAIEQGKLQAQLPTGGATKAGEASFRIPGTPGEAVIVRLDMLVSGKLADRNDYILSPQLPGRPPLAPLMGIPRTRLEVKAVHRETNGAVVLTIRNSGSAIAWLTQVESDGASFCQQNGITLLPGEEAQFHVEPGMDTSVSSKPKLSASAFNADTVAIDWS